MKLLTVGDSFTYGEELGNLNDSWPNLLAQQLGAEVNNLGKPAAGNTKIIRTVIEQADTADIIVVAWSHFARMEMADEHGIYSVWPGNA